MKVKITDIHESQVRDHRDIKPMVGASREARRVTVMPSSKGLSSEVVAKRFPEVPTVPSLVSTGILFL